VDDKAIWGAILEKALAKVKGNYQMTNKGDMIGNGLSLVTGVPVFTTNTGPATDANTIYNELKAAEDAHYIMSIGTSG